MIYVSLFMEVSQYVLAVGRSDITDVLLNTLGGVIGIGMYYIITWIFSKHRYIMVAVASVLIAVLELYMFVSFILFGEVRLGFMVYRI